MILFIGLPLAYGTAWLLWFSPVHLIQRLKDVKILYSDVWEKRATAIFAVVVLIPVLFWTPIGGHATNKLFLRGEHTDIFVPVYPTDDSTARDIKVWEIRYPPGYRAS